MNSENKLLAFSQTIPNFRLNRKKLYLSENIVFITILAVICGAETWEEIEDYGIVKYDFFRKHIRFGKRNPFSTIHSIVFLVVKACFF